MKMHFLRHATFIITVGEKNLLFDPMLSTAGAMPPVPDVANSSANPLVPLPTAVDLKKIDALIVTHNHRDHFDEAAAELLPYDLPLFCQPVDQAGFAQRGFTQVRAVDGSLDWEGLILYRTGGQHGTGKIGQKMGPVSGFVVAAETGPVVYVAGDTIYCREVEEAIEKYHPTVIICFAGAARFSKGDPITMSREDIGRVCAKAPDATIVAVHMEAWNHCTLTRRELADYLKETAPGSRVLIPADGELLNI